MAKYLSLYSRRNYEKGLYSLKKLRQRKGFSAIAFTYGRKYYRTTLMSSKSFSLLIF